MADAVAGDPDAVVTEVEAVAPTDADMAEQPAVVTEVTETVVVNDGPAITTTTVATSDADGDTVVVRLSRGGCTAQAQARQGALGWSSTCCRTCALRAL